MHARTKEELYQQFGFDVNSLETVIKNLVKHPRLLEWPIVENLEKLFWV